jgi:hypothetical protein
MAQEQKTVYIRIRGLSDVLQQELLKHMSIWDINHPDVGCLISTKPIKEAGAGGN